MGYSPWGCKEQDTTKQLTHTHKENLESHLSWTVMLFKEEPCLFSTLYLAHGSSSGMAKGCGNGKKKLFWVEITDVVVTVSKSCLILLQPCGL